MLFWQQVVLAKIMHFSASSFFLRAALLTIDFQAIERSRLRIAAARQQSETPEQSPQPANLTTPVPAEQGTPHSTEAQGSQAIASGSGLTEMVANPAPSQAEHGFKVYSSPSKSSQKTPTKPIDPALADLMEKKLTSSIEQIEKMVKKNQKKAAQPSKRANQRRTLMSMRWVEYSASLQGEEKVHLRLVLQPAVSAAFLAAILTSQSCSSSVCPSPQDLP